MKRAILVVLDSVGVGELKDAKNYGDEGSHTLDNVYKTCNGLKINGAHTWLVYGDREVWNGSEEGSLDPSN